MVVVAVRPGDVKGLLLELRGLLKEAAPVLLSIAAGVKLSSLQTWGHTAKVVRTIPNTPCLVNEGMTGMFCA